MLYYLLKYPLSFLFYIFWRPKVIDRKNLRVKGGAIYISNHVSMKDPIIIALVSPRFVHYMAKSELFTHWAKRLLLRAFLAFPVNRKTTDMKALNEATRLMKKGNVFGIFPEGTRSKDGNIAPFEKGAAFLAVKSNMPIIPIYIDKKSYGMFKRPIIAVGEKITIEELGLEGSKTAMIETLTQVTEQAVRELERKVNLMKQ